MHKADFTICDGMKALRPVALSLEAELAQPQPEKGVVTLTLDESCLRIHIESVTISGLRALSNSFLYLLHAAMASIEVAEDGNSDEEE